MINKEMNDKSEKIEQKEENPVNEVSGFYFSSVIKIFDPNTEEILVQERGDN